MHQLKQHAIIDELYFSLLGMDTTHISVTWDNIRTHSIDPNFVLPFEYLICKAKYFRDIPLFDPFIETYYTKIQKLQSSSASIEEMFVLLQEYTEIFRQLEQIYKSETFDLYDKKESAVNRVNCTVVNDGKLRDHLKFSSSSTLDYFYDIYKTKMAQSILTWINEGKPGSAISVAPLNGYSSFYYESMFRFNFGFCIGQEDASDILECGKIIHLCRMAFNKEICKTECKDLTSISIRQHKERLIYEMNLIVRNETKDEIRLLYDVVLCRDSILYSKIAEGVDIIHENSKIAFKKSGTSFNEYLLKLLKSNTKHENLFSLDESFPLLKFYAHFKPNILKYFFSPKTFNELKIINRYLIMIFSYNYHLERLSEKNSITRAIYLIIHKLRDIPIKDISSQSITQFEKSFKDHVWELLHNYNLTNLEIFECWSIFFDFTKEVIYMDQNKKALTPKHKDRLKQIIGNLQQNIMRYGENDISDLLYNILMKL